MVCVVPKLQGLVSKCKTLLPREKSCPLAKGWGVGCLRLLETIIPAISPHAPSWCRLPWKTEYHVSGAGVRVRLSLTPIKSIQLDLGLLDLATRLHEEDT